MDFKPFSKLTIDLDFDAVGRSFARGNENNLDQPDGVYYLGPGFSPGYGVTNVGAHYQVTKLQISARLSTTFPRACSGLMYAAVPRMTPACVAAMLMVGESRDGAGGVPPIFARPKSSTFTTPSALVLMLAGFRSRCVISFSCAASSAAAICAAILSASSSGIAPSRMRSASVGPPPVPSPGSQVQRRRGGRY
jgi:hypothetical protein